MTDAQIQAEIAHELRLIRECLAELIRLCLNPPPPAQDPPSDEKHDSGHPRRGTGHSRKAHKA